MYRYNQAWLTVSERQEFIFKVRASQGVYVRLATYLGDAVSDIYTVGVGTHANSFSMIWKDGENGSPVQTPGILDQYELRAFWVTWRWGFIEFGKGLTPGLDRLVGYEDMEGFYEVNALSLSSDTTATWEVGQGDGAFVYSGLLYQYY